MCAAAAHRLEGQRQRSAPRTLRWRADGFSAGRDRESARSRLPRGRSSLTGGPPLAGMAYCQPRRPPEEPMAESNPYADRNAKVSQPQSADDYTVVLIDDPAPHVRRVTLNRPEKRNALNHASSRVSFCMPSTPETSRSRRSRHDRARRPGRVSRPGTTSAAAMTVVEYPFFTSEGEGRVASPRHRELDEYLGSGETGDRSGARLLSRGRQ